MKHLQSFNERQLVKNLLFNDEKLISTVINSLTTKCPPKDVKVTGKPIKPVRKFQINQKLQLFKTITFFTTTPTENDFKITNIKLDLYCEDYLLRTNLIIIIFIDGKQVECSESSKEKLYSIVKNYI